MHGLENIKFESHKNTASTVVLWLRFAREWKRHESYVKLTFRILLYSTHRLS